MSSQQWQACLHGSLYNAFKADVFALGAALLHMVTLTSPAILLSSMALNEAVVDRSGLWPVQNC